jgi:hypothetical protein
MESPSQSPITKKQRVDIVTCRHCNLELNRKSRRDVDLHKAGRCAGLTTHAPNVSVPEDLSSQGLERSGGDGGDEAGELPRSGGVSEPGTEHAVEPGPTDAFEAGCADSEVFHDAPSEFGDPDDDVEDVLDMVDSDSSDGEGGCPALAIAIATRTARSLVRGILQPKMCAAKMPMQLPGLAEKETGAVQPE